VGRKTFAAPPAQDQNQSGKISSIRPGNPVGIKSLIADLVHPLGPLSHSHSPVHIISGGAWLDDYQVRVLSKRDRADLLVFAQVDALFNAAILIASEREKPAFTGNSVSRRSQNPDSAPSEPVGSELESNRPPAAKARSSSRRATHPQRAETNGVAFAPIGGHPLNRTSASRRRVSCLSTGR